jgi:hypothetical protein
VRWTEILTPRCTDKWDEYWSVIVHISSEKVGALIIIVVTECAVLTEADAYTNYTGFKIPVVT